MEEAGVKLAGSRVGVLDAAYLENLDDTRNTPAASLCAMLRDRRAVVVAHDHHVREQDWVESEGGRIPLT